MNIDKIKELKKCIGESVSENFSPTHRAKLLAIDESRSGGVCIMEVVESPYPAHSFSASNNHRAGERYEAPISRIWNAYFY
jgi:hypothetical protein